MGALDKQAFWFYISFAFWRSIDITSLITKNKKA